MSVQEDVDKSDHISPEEVMSNEYLVNENDLNGQEKMIESLTDNQKFTEDLDVRSVPMTNDLEVLSSSPTDYPGSLNGACVCLDAGGGGEVDISRGFRNLHLDAALHPDDIHLEIVNGSPAPGTTLYECVGQDPETAFCTLANRDASSADESSIQHCLYQFTQNEKLRDANKLLCEVCSRRQCGAPKANLKGTGPSQKAHSVEAMFCHRKGPAAVIVSENPLRLNIRIGGWIARLYGFPSVPLDTSPVGNRPMGMVTAGP